MNERRPEWADALRDAPFAKPRFTDSLKREIAAKAKQQGKGRQRGFPARLLPAAAVVLVCASLWGLAQWAKPETSAPPSPPVAAQGPWEVRREYMQDGKTLFSVSPDPYLTAGKPTGYKFSFSEPLETFIGKELAIYAVHKDSGLRVTAVPPYPVTEPSPGYPGLERYTASFGLPYSGIWRYEVELDGHPYGDVVLQVAEPSWEVSPMFKTGSYQLRGIAGKVGFIDAGFIAGRTNKYMWHVWGKDRELEGEFKVMAVKQGETELVPVFSASSLGGPNNGADRHTPSSMSLPEPGLWRLVPYIGDRMLDSIVVEVR